MTLSVGLRFRRSYIYVAVIFNIKVMHYVKKKLTQAYIVWCKHSRRLKPPPKGVIFIPPHLKQTNCGE